MPDYDSVDDVRKHILEVDGTLRDGREAADDAKRVVLDRLYSRYAWGKGPTPIPPKGAGDLNLEDLTADKRWEAHFKGHRTHLGLFRSRVGYYWLHRFDPATQEHQLEHVGTAADAAERFGG